MKEVVIYTTLACPYCIAAKKLLGEKGVSYKEVDVTGDDAKREKLVEMSGGRVTVPQIFVDGDNIGGYQELVEFFNRRGSRE